VISASEDPNERVDSYGAFCTPFEKKETRGFILTRSAKAPFGLAIRTDLLIQVITCDLLEYGAKQYSEFLANYTVAKITMIVILIRSMYLYQLY